LGSISIETPSSGIPFSLPSLLGGVLPTGFLFTLPIEIPIPVGDTLPPAEVAAVEANVLIDGAKLAGRVPVAGKFSPSLSW
jgi:hypothetical protein